MPRVFDQNKIHQVPTLIMDHVMQLNNLGNTPEVRESYAQRLESIKQYCEMVLDKYYQSRKEAHRISKIKW